MIMPSKTTTKKAQKYFCGFAAPSSPQSPWCSVVVSAAAMPPVASNNSAAKFADVINWTVYAMIIADEKGITSANVDDFVAGDDPEAVRLLGGEGELQTGMGLAADAFYQAIKQVGNYDELFTRNLEPVTLTREGSFNASWVDGGLIYAPPSR